MANILDSLNNLFSSGNIFQASANLNENSSDVTKAISVAVPSILGLLLSKGNDKNVESVLTDSSQSTNILSSISDVFSGQSSNDTKKLGSQFLNSILGNNSNAFFKIISSLSGVSVGGSNKLISDMVAPVISSFLGNKMKEEKLGFSGLLNILDKEKEGIFSAIPEDLTGMLGLSGLNKSKSSKPKSKDMQWLKWFIPLLIVLLIFLCWRSCSKRSEKAQVTSSTEILNNAEKPEKELIRLVLPDGTQLTAYKGGIEEQIINFLQSDEYKNATSDNLKDKWFDFDNINFVFGSSTELTNESYPQIDNIVTILNHLNDPKIKIGAYTDKKGNPEANLKISQDRANTIKIILLDKGLKSQIVGAEGYGDQFATVSADASDEARAVDRRIAIRFDK